MGWIKYFKNVILRQEMNKKQLITKLNDLKYMADKYPQFNILSKKEYNDILNFINESNM